MSNKISIAVVLFDGVNAIDIAGPIEAFSTARLDGEPIYEVKTLGLASREVRSESHLTLLADELLATQSADLLLIPGGSGIREPNTLKRLASWLTISHTRFSKVVSVCTGAYALAEAGLLEGRHIATHWQFVNDLQKRYPKITVDSDALYLRDGKFFSSGGVTAGIDLALDLIESDAGSTVAMAVARELVVFLRRKGAQSQYSEPLKAQSVNQDRLGGVAPWIANNLNQDLSVAKLSAHVNLSERQFLRRFKTEFGQSPAGYVRTVRLNSARALLDQGCLPSLVHQHIGFVSEDGFRRAFTNKFGVSPSEYQGRFMPLNVNQ